MRKFMIVMAATGTALVAASPAAAQYYPTPQPAPYGYNGYNQGYNGYNQGYNGYGYNCGQVRALQARLNNVERQINRLDRRNYIRDRGADRLRNEANRIEDRLRDRARGGLNPYEARDIEARIARLEQNVQYAMSNRYGGYNNGYGYGYGYNDRDRDGRDDRYERRDRDDDDDRE